MDAGTFEHFSAWADRVGLDVPTFNAMAAFVDEHPDVIPAGRSWPEIRNMVEAR